MIGKRISGLELFDYEVKVEYKNGARAEHKRVPHNNNNGDDWTKQSVPIEDSATGVQFFDIIKEQMEPAGGNLNLQEIGRKAREAWKSRGLAKSWETQVLENPKSRCGAH
ncbi:hypothetical protein CHU98_g8336 [Xylaria longipes]|nr:hypothetical protein CHU98_g8336 [Xylaria longipes]